VPQGCGQGAGDIFIQAAAKCHVQDLRAAADREQRFIRLQNEGDEGALKVIAFGVNAMNRRIQMAAIECRVHISATAEHKTVKAIHKLGQSGYGQTGR